VAEVVAIAKRDLQAGEVLDGIGGETVYGEIDVVDQARDFVPVGLSEGIRLTAPVAAGEPIPRCAVEVPEGEYVWSLRMLQDAYFQSFEATEKYAV
jgi:predicted homoserine dehydrogenase-like protein